MKADLDFVRVHTSIGNPARGWLAAGGVAIPCALGRSGIARRKREGDGVTPRAVMPLRRVWYRPDRGPRPVTGLSVRAIRPGDGWCDAPADRNYNRRVDLPYPASHELMWREDALYDLVVELGWNDDPPRAGLGSAIFMHVARAGFRPTEGCIALREGDLRRLLRRIGQNTLMIVD